jgi:NADP-dependent 3-hydroxy acid dehydrogenase YdfG
MISATVIGLGSIAAAVGYFASEIYLAKKASTPNANLNHRNPN